MRKKLSLICICLLTTVWSWAQEENPSRFGYGLTFGMGNATLNHNQIGVLNGDLMALNFLVDYSLSSSHKTKLSSGIRIIDFNADFFNGSDQSKLRNESMQLPIQLSHRVGFDAEDKLQLVTGIGVYTNVLLRSTLNTREGQTNTKSGGLNFGHSITLGMAYQLSAQTSFGIYADVMQEWNSITRNGYRQKQTDILLFNVGFMTRF